MSGPDDEGCTPLDQAFYAPGNTRICDLLLETYVERMESFGNLALHAILRDAEYVDDTQDEVFHPPLHPVRVRHPVAHFTWDNFAIGSSL